MSVKVTNRTRSVLSIPSPIGDNLRSGESKVYPYVEWDAAINDSRIRRLLAKHRISVDNLDSCPQTDVTSGPLDIYVDAALGSDSVGEGTLNSPYATPTRGMLDVPEIIRHKVHVHIAAGTYTDFPDRVQYMIESDGQLTIEGTGAPTTVYGPFAITNYSMHTSWTHSIIQVAAAGWAVDQFYGKWVFFTSGTAAGFVLPVHSNTADTIITNPAWSWIVGAIAPGDTFEIVDPPAIISVNHPIEFELLNHSFAALPTAPHRAANSKMGIGSIKFETSATYANTPFSITGGSNVCDFVTFQVPEVPDWWNPVRAFNTQDAEINMIGLADPSGFDNPFLNVGMSRIQAAVGTTPVVSGFDYIAVYINNSQVLGLCTRVIVQLRKFCYLAEACIPRLVLFWNVRAQMATVYVNNHGLGAGPAVTCNDHTTSSYYTMYIEDIGGSSAMVGAACTRMLLYAVTGNTANIPNYALELQHICQVSRYSSTTISGTTNDVYFVVTSTAAAWPAVSTTDNAGSFVTTIP